MASFRRFCGQEAAYRLSSLQMIQTSRTSVYLNGRYPKDQFRKLKPKIELESLPSNSTDIFRNNIFDYYCARPTDLEQISIYSFASGYQKVLRQKSFKTREASSVHFEVWCVVEEKKEACNCSKLSSFPSTQWTVLLQPPAFASSLSGRVWIVTALW